MRILYRCWFLLAYIICLIPRFVLDRQMLCHRLEIDRHRIVQKSFDHSSSVADTGKVKKYKWYINDWGSSLTWLIVETVHWSGLRSWRSLMNCVWLRGDKCLMCGPCQHMNTQSAMKCMGGCTVPPQLRFERLLCANKHVSFLLPSS